MRERGWHHADTPVTHRLRKRDRGPTSDCLIRMSGASDG